MIDTATISPDPDLDARTRAYSARLDGLLSMEVGRLEENIDTRRETVRGGESAFANTVVDTLRLALDADVALFNGGGIRGTGAMPPEPS
ncbi:5'-nucleotidase C-terminal domain-containing protein [Azospirillum thermophilum]|uniref:5'-nucleotidase C-terminal domain-containing protein n=1 Tax=Azospirillum thermophilum TaxID=2202148 RepID=UPI002481E6A3|nr:5'-nucleotidase C-terminal domain-containing protein [Azospirillum thermophilum]